MSEFIFKLEKPVDYQRDGQNLQAEELRLIAPSYKQKDNCQAIKQFVHAAIKPAIDEARKKIVAEGKDVSDLKVSQDEEDEVIKSKDYINLFLSSNLPIDRVMNTFEKLLLSGVCFIDGIKITKTILEQISLSDFENLFGEYMTHFLSIS